MVRLLARAAEAAAEGHPVEPEHVEGGERGRHDADRPDVAPVAARRGRPTTGSRPSRRSRRAAGCRRSRCSRSSIVRCVFGSFARRPPIWRMSCSPDIAWITEPEPRNEQRLEEGVRQEVEDARAEGPDAAGEEHVAELAHRRVGEHALDVVLDEADRGGEDRRRGAHDRDRRHRVRRVSVDRGGAGDHVDAGGHHRGRVDQRGDRRRALHRVGQPDVQRDLRALAGGADEEQQPDERERPAPGPVDRQRARRPPSPPGSRASRT